MYVYERFIGRDFTVNLSGTDRYPLESGQLSLYRDTIDLRTNYVCVGFSGDKSNPLGNTEWYKNYLKLQVFLVNEGSTDKVSGYHKNQAYSMLRMGFVPVGYSPSFFPEMTIAITQLLEHQGIKYVKTYPTSFVHPFYKNVGSRDLWVSKLDGAELLGCSPEAVTALKIFERITG